MVFSSSQAIRSYFLIPKRLDSHIHIGSISIGKAQKKAHAAKRVIVEIKKRNVKKRKLVIVEIAAKPVIEAFSRLGKRFMD